MKQKKDFQYFLLLLIGLLSCVCSAESVDIDNITFTDTLLKVGAGQPSVLVTDFNSDGNQDVIVANYSDNNIIAYQGNSKGSLVEVGRFSVGENPTGMASSDINDDGHVDLVIANHETSYVTLLFGDGKGGFKQTPQSSFEPNIEPHPHAVRLNDLDGDGRADLIVDSRTHQGLRVLKGLANGNFETPGKIINAGGDPYRGFAINDLNGDGYLDLVTPNQNDIGILINTKPYDLSFSLSKLAQSESPFAVELADFDGDGNVDLIVATNSNLITVVPGDGRGNFIEKRKTEIKSSAGAKQIAVGDVNGDGITDALISNWSGEIIAVLGSKSTIETIRFKHSKIPNPWAVALADLNKDGKSDLIIADGNSESAVVYISQ